MKNDLEIIEDGGHVRRLAHKKLQSIEHSYITYGTAHLHFLNEKIQWKLSQQNLF